MDRSALVCVYIYIYIRNEDQPNNQKNNTDNYIDYIIKSSVQTLSTHASFPSLSNSEQPCACWFTSAMNKNSCSVLIKSSCRRNRTLINRFSASRVVALYDAWPFVTVFRNKRLVFAYLMLRWIEKSQSMYEWCWIDNGQIERFCWQSREKSNVDSCAPKE
jgi:hypothetical protein